MRKLIKKINPDLFIESITKESAYTLGLLWADGYVEKKTNVVNIECVAEDMDFFGEIINTTGNWQYYVRTRKNRRTIVKAHTSNKVLNSYLIENDFSNKSIESPTKILSKIPKNLIKYFLLGVIDGDGCFYFNKKYGLRQFTIAGSLNQNWDSFEKILKNLNIEYKIIRKKNNKTGYSHLRITNKMNIKKLGEFIYSSIKEDYIGLPRKYQKYLNIIE